MTLAALGRSQAIIEFDLDGTVLTANQKFLDALGYTLADRAEPARETAKRSRL